MIPALALYTVLATAQPQADAKQDAPKMPAGMLDGSKLKEDFNADKDKVRLMFIFSPS